MEGETVEYTSVSLIKKCFTHIFKAKKTMIMKNKNKSTNKNAK